MIPTFLTCPVLLTGASEITASVILTAISSLGFPIVMCFALFYYILKDSKATREELKKLSDALNNNSFVIQQFLDKKGE